MQHGGQQDPPQLPGGHQRIVQVAAALVATVLAQWRRLRAERAAKRRRRIRRAVQWLVARQGRARRALGALMARLRLWGWYLRGRYRIRRCWAEPIATDWWEDDVLGLWGDRQWLAHFRMTRATFFEIVEELRPLLERTPTVMRRPIPVEKRVAIGIWRLATPSVHRTTATQFGVGISTAAQIVLEVCFALESSLLSRIVRLGDVREVSGPLGGGGMTASARPPPRPASRAVGEPQWRRSLPCPR